MYSQIYSICCIKYILSYKTIQNELGNENSADLCGVWNFSWSNGRNGFWDKLPSSAITFPTGDIRNFIELFDHSHRILQVCI